MSQIWIGYFFERTLWVWIVATHFLILPFGWFNTAGWMSHWCQNLTELFFVTFLCQSWDDSLLGSSFELELKGMEKISHQVNWSWVKVLQTLVRAEPDKKWLENSPVGRTHHICCTRVQRWRQGGKSSWTCKVFLFKVQACLALFQHSSVT